VKPVGNPAAPSELYLAHTTWNGASSMSRVYKLYDLPFTVSGTRASGTVPGAAMAFSSYPALLVSWDDFYTISSGLAVSETTIQNYNPALWVYVGVNVVLEWVRNMVANRLAYDGASWVATFSPFNSGTYNNMWHVVNYNKFTPGAPLADGTLTVLEQMPGPNIVAGDHTDALRTAGYWASYNRVADPGLFVISGQPAMVARYGPLYTYNATARALIFARNQSRVVDEPSLRALMRYNNFQADPLAVQGCNPGVPSAMNAISARGDLVDPIGGCVPLVGFRPEEGTDTKYTSAAMMASGNLSSWAQSGPTYDQQPPFRWSTGPFSYMSHIGMPDVYTFPWMRYDWSLATW